MGGGFSPGVVLAAGLIRPEFQFTRHAGLAASLEGRSMLQLEVRVWKTLIHIIIPKPTMLMIVLVGNQWCTIVIERWGHRKPILGFGTMR